MERIELSSLAWKARAQPIYHTRIKYNSYSFSELGFYYQIWNCREESQALKISLVATLFLRLLTHLKGLKNKSQGFHP